MNNSPSSISFGSRPHGVLFRGSAEGKIRQGLLQEELFEAVIGLAPNLFYGTGIPASVLVLNRDKAAARKGKVLFIDASGEFEEGSNQNRLRDQDIEHIVGTFHACADLGRRPLPLQLSEPPHSLRSTVETSTAQPSHSGSLRQEQSGC